MSDFLHWLYTNYIQPQIDDTQKDEYEFDFHKVRKALSPADYGILKRVLEFTAVHAFLLGFRTSEGLPPLPPRKSNIFPLPQEEEAIPKAD